MGCDGGTIPKRDELVRTKKKKADVSKDVKLAAKWNNCHLSQLELQKPIVADLLGFLYNKESFIEYLLDKSKYESGPEYAKTLKDVKELNLVDNPCHGASKSEEETTSLMSSKWICPITGLEMNGSFKFYYLFSCGCVFSDRAYKQINQSKSTCLKCEKEFNENDLIIINPASEEEVSQNKAKMEKRKELALKLKQDKLSKKESKASKEPSTSSTSTISSSKSDDSTKKLSKSINESDSTSLKRSLDVKNGEVNKREHSFDINKKLKSTIESSSAKSTKSSIQDNPNHSEVYKSIFNTCEKAKNQSKAHWVTFNPQFY